MEKLENTLTEEQKETLLLNFGKFTVKQIAELINIKERSVSKFYQNRKMKLTKEQKRIVFLNRPTLYERNHDFFSDKSTESIYWAGFLAADGCVIKGRLRLKIKYTDKEHVEKFKESIEYTGKIKKDCSKRLGKLHCGALIYISSHKICKDLEEIYNITENKSLNLIPPKIKGNEIDYFIVGYFDGDGTIYNKKNYRCCRFYGTKEINTWIKNRIDTLYGKNSGSIFKKENIWCYELNPKATEFFMKYYGELNSPKLTRKWKNDE